ncbi:MAG TPA: tetratricopeptide repeat protein [Stenomitos sp.]
MGIRAFKEGRIAEAIVFLEYATKFNPDNHQVWLMLARAYQKDGQSMKAAEAYKLVLDRSQDTRLMGFAREGLGSIGDHRALAAVQVAPTKVTCPECGVAIPETRLDRPWCNCGWNNRSHVVLTNRVFLSDIQAYCRRRSVRISILFRGDVIVLAASEVQIQGMGTRTYPVNPRLLFNSQHGMLCIEMADLDKVMPKVSDDALFRERNAGDDLTMGKLYSFSQFLARLSEFRGYDVSTKPPDTSLAGVLASYNALDQELINDALELREEGETLGQTILRLGISNFEAMVSAVVGDFRIAKPGARPFHERLGTLMLSKGLVSPVQLQEALAQQPRIKKPVGEILVNHLKACSATDLQAAVKSQRPLNVMLPEADMLGELLVARKKVTRTDMLQALADEQTKRRVPLGEVLINMGLITHQDLQGVLGWQSQKKRLIQTGVARLGEILMNQNVLTAEQLGEALKIQVLDTRPLGQILVAQGFCTPEQVLGALEAQIVRRNQMAAGVLDPEVELPRRGAPTTSLKAPTAKLAATKKPIKGQTGVPKAAIAAVAAVLVLALVGLGLKLAVGSKSEAPPPVTKVQKASLKVPPHR